MCIFHLHVYFYLGVTCQSVIDHFISRYKYQNKFANNENWSPYQCKTFINLAFIVHKNPKTKTQDENKLVAMMEHAGNVGSDSEIIFSDVTTQTKLEKIFEDQNSSSSNGLPEVILIEGAPGIGKTVVAKEIAYRWAQNTMLSNIKLLLLITLREADISQITGFKELMLHCYGEDKEAASNCAQYFINTQGKSLMIIFDGFDEMATEEQEKADAIFMKLLNKHSVPECYLVVTSRPNITANLRQYCNCRVEIIGFTKNDRHKCLKENLSYEQFKIVDEFLQEHLIIDSLCYIPLNLMSFLKLVEYTPNKDKLPKTQTKLTEYTVRLTIARNKEKKGKFVRTVPSFQDTEIDQVIKTLAPFAYKMLKDKKLVFSEKELKRANICVKDDDDKYGLLKAVQLNTVESVQPKKVYSFVHFSVQEYLAAYHLSTQFNITQSFALSHKFWDDRYFGIWIMYTGLTNGDKLPLKKFLSGEWYFIASLRNLFGIEFPGIHKELKENKITYLRLYQMFLEAPESKIKDSLKEVVESGILKLSKQKFTLNDMNMLSYFVARSCITQQWKSIDLSDCNIDDNRLQNFKHGLCIEDGRKKPIIDYLDISNNENICELKTIIKFITECKLIVYLKASNIFQNEYIAAKEVAVNDCNRTLQILDLSGNKLQSKDVDSLCNGLVHCKNLEKLDLSNNEIDDSATSFLAKAIVQWDNFKTLKIENNAFNDDSNRLIEFTIMHHLKCNTTEMKLLDFERQPENIKLFILLLGYAKDVRSEDSCYINCISQLGKLSLECVQSDHIALTKDAAKFFCHFKILEEINLSGISISKESAKAIAFGNKLQHLKMNRCNLKSNAAKFIADRLKIHGSIEKLQLCNNSIDDIATERLVVAFLYCNSLVRFEFAGNQFSKSTELLFEFLLSHLKFSDLSLNLSGDFNALSSFITLLGYTKQVPTDKSCYVENISKITNLNLSCLDHQATHTPLRLTVTSSEGFQIFNQLESLDISGIIVNEDIANHLVKVFEINLQLKRLVMNKCQITSPTVVVFCRQLKKVNSLRVFELSENSVDDEAIEELAIAILHWNLLECINIENNRFSDHGKFLLRMLTKDVKPKSTMDFGNNIIVVKSFITVLKYASDNSGKIFLSNLSKAVKLSLEVKSHLELMMTFEASVTLNKLRNITLLNVSGITITEQVANNLCDLFDKNNKSLKHLSMNHCGLTSSTVSKFADKLKLAITITDVHFCENKIDDNATKSLAVAILHWNVLETIRLENNHFTNDSIHIFKILTEQNKLSGTSIDFNGRIDKVIAFITSLGYMSDIDIKNSILIENVSKIKKLHLDCSEQNNVNVQFEFNASKFFTRFVSLVYLNLSGIVISEEVADNLANALDSNLCSLEHLIMNNCQLKSVKVLDVIKKLRKCVNMRELQLCNNLIDDDVAENLVVSILLLNSLEILRLGRNHFGKNHKSVFHFLMNNLKFSDSKIPLSVFKHESLWTNFQHGFKICG